MVYVPEVGHTLKAKSGCDFREDSETHIAFAQNSRDEVRLQGGDGQVVGALAANEGMKQRTYIHSHAIVRRLTPLECERLQGYPDGWTDIGEWTDSKGDWREMLRKGYTECFRVLDPDGVLIFKWSEVQIPLKEILPLSPYPPLFGHRSGKNMNTHWLCFMKPKERLEAVKDD